MATIVLAPSDVRSKRLAADRLAARLRGAGHRVVMLVREGEDAPASGEHRVLDLRAVDDGRRRRWRPVAQLLATRRASDAIPVERLAPLLAELDADLLIVDIEEHETVLAALATAPDTRLAILHSFFSIWPDRALPPLDHAMPVADDRLDRVRVATAWRSTRMRLRYRDARYHLAGRRIERTATVRRLARRLGVAARMDRRVWLHPFAARDLPTIVVGARELDLPCRIPSHVHHVGPLLDALTETSSGNALGELVGATVGPEQRVVTCAFGAFVDGSGVEMFARLVTLARRRPDLVLVVGGVGAELAATAEGVVNLVARQWIPQRELLAVSSAAIVHSGTFTLHECVAARVPAVVFPFVVNDQLGNAERVRHHGIGVVGDRAGDSAAAIERHLDHVLDNADMAARIERLGARIDAYERDGVPVAVVESLLAAPHRPLSDS